MTTTPRVILMMLGATLTTASARAHFVWVTVEDRDAEPRAHVYFGEAAEPDSAEYLDRLTRLKAWRRSADGEYQPLELRKVETDDGGSLTGPV
ncbi:MAG: hypothetical protein L0206_11155, partial [Actinobacteria bacterium]|nr:hypothetical protein [Actinomycetota bacterium]